MVLNGKDSGVERVQGSVSSIITERSNIKSAQHPEQIQWMKQPDPLSLY
jgi:hypothetical protein